MSDQFDAAMVEAVALLLANGSTAGADGVPRVGRQSRKKATAILRTLAARGALLPKGWVAVPREPTDAMLDAWDETLVHTVESSTEGTST